MVEVMLRFVGRGLVALHLLVVADFWKWGQLTLCMGGFSEEFEARIANVIVLI